MFLSREGNKKMAKLVTYMDSDGQSTDLKDASAQILLYHRRVGSRA